MTGTRNIAVALTLMFSVDFAHAAEQASECMELRGFAHNARIQNTCNYDVNLIVCCDGEGNLSSCRGLSVSPMTIEAKDSPFIGSCSGNVFWIACPVPAMPTTSISWVGQHLRYYGDICVEPDL